MQHIILNTMSIISLLVSASGFVSSELVVTINGEDYTITRNADAQGNGAELHLRKNSVITVKIKTIPSGYKFDKWGLVYANVTSTADPYTFTLTRDLEILHGYLSKASRLPAGYTEVEYVHFPGGTATYFSQAIPSHTQAIAPSIELDVKLGTKNPGTNKILISTSSPNGLTRYFSLTTEGSFIQLYRIALPNIFCEQHYESAVCVSKSKGSCGNR